MRSSFTPWDFVKANPTVRPNISQGIFALNFPDPYIEKIILNRFEKNFISGKLISLIGPDLTIEWIENNLLSFDLFGGCDSYLVLHAEDISQKVRDYLTQQHIQYSGRFLILCFSKGGKDFDKISKSLEGEFITIAGPKFWEGRKLLDFLASELKLMLPYEVSNYLLEAIQTDDSSDLYSALNLIKLHFSNERVDIVKVKELISSSKLDHFKLATLLGQKKYEQFWKHLDSIDLTFDQLRTFFSFMSGHLYKMLDTSYTIKKGKLTKYDQEIISLSKQWKKENLLLYIRLFSELEVMSKSKDMSIYQKIRLIYIESL